MARLAIELRTARAGCAPTHHGGEYLYVSPGLTVTPTDRLAGYAYVQVPIMHRVNGIQLISEGNLLVGLTYTMDI